MAIRQVLAVLMIVAIGLGVAACGIAPTAPRWKLDVLNRNGPVQVGITTDREAWAWIVPAGAQMVLVQLPESREGAIEILAQDCAALYTGTVGPGSFTIVIEPGDTAPEVSVRLDAGAPLPGPANADYDAWCTG